MLRGWLRGIWLVRVFWLVASPAVVTVDDIRRSESGLWESTKINGADKRNGMERVKASGGRGVINSKLYSDDMWRACMMGATVDIHNYINIQMCERWQLTKQVKEVQTICARHLQAICARYLQAIRARYFVGWINLDGVASRLLFLPKGTYTFLHCLQAN